MMYKPHVVTGMVIGLYHVGFFFNYCIYMYDEIFAKLYISTCQPQTHNQYHMQWLLITEGESTKALLFYSWINYSCSQAEYNISPMNCAIMEQPDPSYI